MAKRVKVNGKLETVTNSYGASTPGALQNYDLASGGYIREIAPGEWVRWIPGDIIKPVNVRIVD